MGLDYLGLGDWHDQRQIGPATWYSGTPEADGFKHAAASGALLVTLALLVLAVCGRLALDLFLTPDDFYAIQPGIG